MVHTRPTNKIPKITDSYKLKSQKTRTHRKIIMDKEDATTPPRQGEDESSPFGQAAELLENLAASGAVPILFDEAEEAAKESQEKQTPTAREAYEGGKEKPPPFAKKRKINSAPSSARTPASSSRTGSSPKPSENDPEKEDSFAESSSGKASSEEDEEQTEPPPKKPKIPTRSSKRVKKAQSAKAKAQVKEERVQRELTVPKTIEWELLDQLEIVEEVRGYFANIGWANYLDWDTMVCTNLAREFFDHLEVKSDKKGEPMNIYFRLKGVDRVSSINELNMQLCIVSLLDLSWHDYLTAERQIPTRMNWNGAWKELAKDEEFVPCVSKVHSLKSPAMRMCHRILSYNFYGKTGSSNTVSKPELFLLWAMHNQMKVNFVSMVAHLFKQITLREQRLCLCNLPGVFAKNQKLLNFDRPMAVEKLDSFNLQTLQKMFRVQPHGKEMLKMTEEKEKPPSKPSQSSRRATSSTPEPAHDDVMAALAKMQETLTEIKEAQLAFFASQNFRYPPESP